ncbi:ABC transporter substrate-binding protein [Actinocorallia aurantiaca]|uniref:ABC transporter substrate-binding protein n=1 Tax=Actinocorallia aurantiaca TaxID=46204 RepID=A0ABN3UPI5_9ACTN
MRRLLAATALLALAVSGCGGSEAKTPAASAPATPAASATPVAASLTVTDPTGETLTLKKAPERIVCLTGICDDILVELGLTPVGTTTPELLTRPDYLGPAGADVPVIPGSFGGEDVTAIAKAKPDLVIGLADVHEGLAPAVEKFAPLWNVRVKSYEESIGYLRNVAALTGRGEQQAKAENVFRAKLSDGASEAEASGLKDKTVLAMYGGGSIGVNTTEDVLGNFLSQYFDYPWPGKGGGFETAQAYSLEEILAKAPQVLFVQSFSFGGSKPVTETYRDNPVWKRIPAVAAGKVYEVQPALWASGRGTRAFGIILEEALAKATG